MEIEESSQIYGDREINNIHVFMQCIYEGSIMDTVNVYTRYWMYTKATLEKMEQRVRLREISILSILFYSETYLPLIPCQIKSLYG